MKNYLFDEINSREALLALLGRVRAAGPGRGSSRGHTLGDDWAVLSRSQEDAAGEMLTREITTFRKTGDLYRRGEETYRLCLIPAQDLRAQLLDLGFEVHTLRRYADVELPPGLNGFLVRKPR